MFGQFLASTVLISLFIIANKIGKLHGEYAECKIWGDPHWRTFDGAYYDYMGTGFKWYYVHDCTPNTVLTTGGTPFKVVTAHTADCMPGYDDVSCVDYIEAWFYDESGSLTDEVRLTVDIDDHTSQVIVNDVAVGTSATGNIGSHGSWDVFTSTPNWPEVMLTLQARFWNGPEGHDEAVSDQDLIITLESGSLWRTAFVYVDSYYKGKICALCGRYDDDSSNDFHFPVSAGASGTAGARAGGTRRLLEEEWEIVTLDDNGIDDWNAMVADSTIWDRVHIFGDEWSTGVVVTNVSHVYFPSEECIDHAESLCTVLWESEDACEEGCNLENGLVGIGFEAWLHGCIYDSCAVAIADGVNLETMEYEDAYDDGYLAGSLADCKALCPTVGGCPDECNTIPCDCRDDDNCRVCQTHGHCSQCEDGYFRKTDRNHECYPCQAYAGEGCMFCQDFHGCGQCESGYTRTLDDDCGLYYCERD